jgi:hypothetical protein
MKDKISYFILHTSYFGGRAEQKLHRSRFGATMRDNCLLVSAYQKEPTAPFMPRDSTAAEPLHALPWKQLRAMEDSSEISNAVITAPQCCSPSRAAARAGRAAGGR